MDNAKISTACGRRPRDQFGIALTNMGDAVGAFKSAQGKVSLRDPLVMIHEDDIDGGSAHGAEYR